MPLHSLKNIWSSVFGRKKEKTFCSRNDRRDAIIVVSDLLALQRNIDEKGTDLSQCLTSISFGCRYFNKTLQNRMESFILNDELSKQDMYKEILKIALETNVATKAEVERIKKEISKI